MIVKMDREALVSLAHNEKQEMDLKSNNFAGYIYSFNIYLDVKKGEYFIKDKDGVDIMRTDGTTSEGLDDLLFYIRGLMEQKVVH